MQDFLAEREEVGEDESRHAKDTRRHGEKIRGARWKTGNTTYNLNNKSQIGTSLSYRLSLYN